MYVVSGPGAIHIRDALDLIRALKPERGPGEGGTVLREERGRTSFANQPQVKAEQAGVRMNFVQ